jgi:hypothetical protein
LADDPAALEPYLTGAPPDRLAGDRA